MQIEPVSSASEPKLGTPPIGKRLLGKQRDLVVFMAPDWDEPLPDEFWDYNRDEGSNR